VKREARLNRGQAWSALAPQKKTTEKLLNTIKMDRFIE
jgi:hypothetical protein